MLQKGKIILILSSVHYDAALDKGLKRNKQEAIYNCIKRGVDTLDQLCAVQICYRKMIPENEK